MSDLLVELYELPSAEPALQDLASRSIVIRAALPHERTKATSRITSRFGQGWADECEAAFARQPVSCHLAIENGAMPGFACHDVTARGFFGPYGVEEGRRREGIEGSVAVLAPRPEGHGTRLRAHRLGRAPGALPPCRRRDRDPRFLARDLPRSFGMKRPR